VITTSPNCFIPHTAIHNPGEFDVLPKETMKTARNKTKIGKNTSSDLKAAVTEDLMILIVDLDSSMRKLLEVRMVMKIMTCACETVTDEKVQMIVRCAETDASQCLDVIMDPSTWSMDGVIMKCACETVTDAKTQMIVRCAETDASQCLDLMILIVDSSTWRMDGVIMKCACENVTHEKIQMIVKNAETDASQCMNLMVLIVDPSTRGMAGVILKCACETVTDEKIQMIVKDAETNATTQCLNLTTSTETQCPILATSTERTVLNVPMARGIMKCA